MSNSPKEVAEQLVKKYEKEILKGKYRVDGFVISELAEECASIMVQGIIEELHDNIACWPPDYPHSITLIHNDRKDFWKQVLTILQSK